jgi:hypothetical protein
MLRLTLGGGVVGFADGEVDGTEGVVEGEFGLVAAGVVSGFEFAAGDRAEEFEFGALPAAPAQPANDAIETTAKTTKPGTDFLNIGGDTLSRCSACGRWDGEFQNAVGSDGEVGHVVADCVQKMYLFAGQHN